MSLLKWSRNQGLSASFPAQELLVLFHYNHGSGVPKILETARSLGILGTFLASVVEPFHQTGECVASYFLVRK